MLSRLENGDHFSWARYGDGEWNCILGKDPDKVNCDGHHYFPDLGEALKKILEAQRPYFLGMQRLAEEQNSGNPEFERLKSLNKWGSSDILHHASIKGQLKPFFNVIKNYDVTIVGPEKLLMNLDDDVVGDFYPLEIPEIDCWKAHNKTLNGLTKSIFRAPDGHYGDLVLYCASMMSEVLIDEMWQIYGSDITQIDLGSVLDPYAGIQSRTYHKNLAI